jgi:hypothetical protein
MLSIQAILLATSLLLIGGMLTSVACLAVVRRPADAVPVETRNERI